MLFCVVIALGFLCCEPSRNIAILIKIYLRVSSGRWKPEAPPTAVFTAVQEHGSSSLEQRPGETRERPLVR